MPKYRTIKPKFWDDIKLSKVTRDARLTFIGMWNFADDLGVIMYELSWLKSKIFPYDKIEFSELDIWINELFSEKIVIQIDFSAEKFIFIPNFLKHQKIEKPNYSDLFIPHKLLIKTLKHSAIDRRLIADRSPTVRRRDAAIIGKERKGIRKGIGREGGEFEEQLFSDTKFFETIGIAWKINQADFRHMVNDFQTTLKVQEKNHSTYAEFKNHFFNWGAQKYTGYLNGAIGKKSTHQPTENDKW